MYKISSVIIGILIAIMVTFNGELAKQVGDLSAVLIINLVGMLAVSFILLIKKQKMKFKKGDIPMYLFFAGGIGVILTFFNNICFKNLGVSLTLALGLVGQVIASGVVDHFGFLGMKVHKFHKKKILGFLMVFVGMIIMVVW